MWNGSPCDRDGSDYATASGLASPNDGYEYSAPLSGFNSGGSFLGNPGLGTHPGRSLAMVRQLPHSLRDAVLKVL